MIPAVNIECITQNKGKCVTQSANGFGEVTMKTAKQVHDAFCEYGFCYFTNHGIPTKQVNNLFASSYEFFNQPVSIKQKYARTAEGIHGWVACERENLNPERPHADMKEAFNFSPCESGQWPAEVPEMKSHFVELFNQCHNLTNQILHLLCLALEIQDLDYMQNCNKLIGQRGNYTTLRSLYYPPCIKELKEGQIQCGEHSDYGSITLLFQDDVGSLQVQGKDGIYHDVTPLANAVLVNIGDLMQRWTADKYPATKHRVAVPKQAMTEGRAQQSFAFFVQPDDPTLISCLDGSSKYPPITSYDYLMPRFQAAY